MGLIEQAQKALKKRLNGASAMGAESAALLAVIAVMALRHVDKLG